MVKVQGQNLSRNAIKQTDKNGQKKLGLRRRSRCDITGAGYQEFEAAEWSWIQLRIFGILWPMAGLLWTDSGWSWIIRIGHLTLRGGTPECHNSWHMSFSFSSLSVLLFEFWPRTFTIEFYINILSDRDYDVGVQRSFLHNQTHIHVLSLFVDHRLASQSYSIIKTDRPMQRSAQITRKPDSTEEDGYVENV